MCNMGLALGLCIRVSKLCYPGTESTWESSREAGWDERVNSSSVPAMADSDLLHIRAFVNLFTVLPSTSGG